MGKTLRAVADRERKAARRVRRKSLKPVSVGAGSMGEVNAAPSRTRIPGLVDDALYPETSPLPGAAAGASEAAAEGHALDSFQQLARRKMAADEASSDFTDDAATTTAPSRAALPPDAFFKKRPKGRAALRKSKNVMKAMTRQASYGTKVQKATRKKMARMQQHRDEAAGKAAERAETATPRFALATAPPS